jgi:hypothetical protein
LGDEVRQDTTAIADAIADATADAIVDAPADAIADAPAATKPRITTEEYEALTLAALVSRNIKRKPASAVAASAKQRRLQRRLRLLHLQHQRRLQRRLRLLHLQNQRRLQRRLRLLLSAATN